MATSSTAPKQPANPPKRRRLVRWIKYLATGALAFAVVLACDQAKATSATTPA